MIVTLQTHRLHTMEQVRAFVEGNEAVDYKHQDRASAYAFCEASCSVGSVTGHWASATRAPCGAFCPGTTGISGVQIDRLIRQWRETGRIKDRRGGNRGRPFERRYTPADIRLLATVDEAFGQMSGLATCELLRRQREVFGRCTLRTTGRHFQ